MRISRRLIDITGMRDIIQRRIPVLSADSKKPGPVVWLTACLHGDEVGGTVIVHDIFAEIRKTGLKCGSVHAFPLINSMGFENVSRFINSDREDLNRCFPGNLRGSMGQQIAHRLFNTILKSKPELVIDLHNDWIRSIPYLLVEPLENCRTKALREKTLRMARASGLLLVEDSDQFHPTRNTLAGAMIEAGIAAFTIEAGGAYAVNESRTAEGKTAILSVLHKLGMIKGASDAPRRNARKELLAYSGRPLCTTSGLIRFAVAPGQEIKAQQVIARVYSAFGSCEETLRAESAGFVLGLEDHARVLPGREIIAIAQQAQRS